MDSKKSNKIRDIVRLQQILKKWKKLANASKNSNTNNGSRSSGGTSSSSSHQTNTSSGGGGASKSMKFLKKTLSLNDVSSANVVPKGFIAVCVGEEEKRFIIPTHYLGHQAFGVLLRKAEEEFGFQQEGVLKIPCEVSIFENILNLLQNKKDIDVDGVFFHDSFGFNVDKDMIASFAPSSHHPQMCR